MVGSSDSESCINGKSVFQPCGWLASRILRSGSEVLFVDPLA